MNTSVQVPVPAASRTVLVPVTPAVPFAEWPTLARMVPALGTLPATSRFTACAHGHTFTVPVSFQSVPVGWPEQLAGSTAVIPAPSVNFPTSLTRAMTLL